MDSHNGKFVKDIARAWEEVRQRYLDESGLKKSSTEWTFIEETKDVSQVIQVITEIWVHHQNPVEQAQRSSEFVPAPLPTVGKVGRIKRFGNKFRSPKDSKNVLRQPQVRPGVDNLSTVEKRVQLEKLPSDKLSPARDVAGMGLQLTDQLYSIKRAGIAKPIVEAVLKLTDALKPFATAADLVSPYVSFALGCIRFFFQVT